MKKILKYITILLIVGVMAVAFTACKDKEGEGGEAPSEEKTTCDAINALLQATSYPFVLTTKITADGDVFNGTYTVTEASGTVSVNYQYEKLSEFETVNGELVAPADYKTTVRGSVKIKEGKVIEQNGAQANLSAESFNTSGIALNESALTDIQMEEGKFSAKVSSISALTGINIIAENVNVNIEYTETKISKLILSYTTTDCQAEITYKFN